MNYSASFLEHRDFWLIHLDNRIIELSFDTVLVVDSMTSLQKPNKGLMKSAFSIWLSIYNTHNQLYNKIESYAL